MVNRNDAKHLATAGLLVLAAFVAVACGLVGLAVWQAEVEKGPSHGPPTAEELERAMPLVLPESFGKGGDE